MTPEALEAIRVAARNFAEHRHGVGSPHVLAEAAWLRAFFFGGISAALRAEAREQEALWFTRVAQHDSGAGPDPGPYPGAAENPRGLPEPPLLPEPRLPPGQLEVPVQTRVQTPSARPETAPTSPSIVSVEPRDGAQGEGLTLSLMEHDASSVPFRSESEVQALDSAANWTPSPDQIAALEVLQAALEQSGFYVLSGAAGCGKTTVLKALLRRLGSQWDIILLAPTWRAANVMRDILGLPAASIHSAVYGAPVTKRRCPVCMEWETSLVEAVQIIFRVEDDGGLTLVTDADDTHHATSEDSPDAPPTNTVSLPRYRCASCEAVLDSATDLPQRLDFALRDGGAGSGEKKAFRLVVVDELGMVSPRVLNDVRSAFLDSRTRILGVGDPNQLPSVSDGEDTPAAAPVEDPGLWPTLESPTAMLHTVHRQAEGNPILALAHSVKVWPEPANPDWPYPHRVAGIEIRQKVDISVPAAWAARLRHAGADMALIAYSNKTRAALNHAVREHTGAAAHAARHGVNLIPGDRLLARANYGGVVNGDVFTLYSIERVPPGRMLTRAGRVPVPHPKYEHDRVLDPEVGVFRAELYRAELPEVRKHVVLVLPMLNGVPQVESDLIRSGVAAGDARRIIRDVARCWISECETALEVQAKALSNRQMGAESAQVARARWMSSAAIARPNLLNMVRGLRDCGADSEALDRLIAEINTGKLDQPAARAAYPCAALESRYEPLLKYTSALDYCVAELGMVSPGEVAVFDFGEALTCHAMQGSQARAVGVVPDGAFWFRWREDRRATMQWCYTAYTRAAETLCLFSLKRAP